MTTRNAVPRHGCPGTARSPLHGSTPPHNERCRQPREAIGTHPIKFAATSDTRECSIIATVGTASEDVIRTPRPPHHPVQLAPRGVRAPAGGVALSMYVHYHARATLSSPLSAFRRAFVSSPRRSRSVVPLLRGAVPPSGGICRRKWVLEAAHDRARSRRLSVRRGQHPAR